MQGFKEYLEEAFSLKSFDKVIELMESYLSKKVGELYKVDEPEEYKKAGETGVGIRYFIRGKGKSIRFNWIKGSKSVSVNSVDLFTGYNDTPDYTFEIFAESVAKYLPKLAQLINNPVMGDHDINESSKMNDELMLIESKTDDVIKLFKQGKTRTEIKAMGFSNGTVFAASKKFKVSGGEITVSQGKTSTTKPGKIEQTVKELAKDDKKLFELKIEKLKTLAKLVAQKHLPSLLVAGAPGTGKSYNIEETWKKMGLVEGVDWKLVKAGVSAVGAYRLMYQYREGFILFDDADGIFKDQEGRNLLKGALDDKAVRRVSWEKDSSMVFPASLLQTDPEEAEKLMKEKHKVPNSFDFTGGIVAISNMAAHKLDPDGALRSRSFMLNIDPTKDAFLDRIKDLGAEIGKKLGIDKKLSKEVLDYVIHDIETRNKQPSLRSISKAIGLAKSGIPDWREIIDLSVS